MKRFIRILFKLLGTVVAIILLFQLFLVIRQSRSGKQQVHKDSEVIIRINVDKIMSGIALNAMLNPREYFFEKTDSLATEDKISLWKAGIAIPANLYFFSTSSDSLAFYALLKLNDKEKFQTYIQQYLDTGIDMIDGSTWYTTTEDNRLSFVGNNQHVLMSVAMSKRDRRDVMQAILMSDDLVNINSLDIPQLSKSKSELTYSNRSNSNHWQVDFSNGQANLAGGFSSKGWMLSDKPEARQMSSDNLLSVWLHADIRPALIQCSGFLKKKNVDIDSIQPFIGNYWEVQWKPTTLLQKDTIISYDYDDNFEMIARQDVRDTPVPDISFSVKASPHLMFYLPEKLFYKFSKRADDGLISLSTNTNFDANLDFEQVPCNFHLLYTPDSAQNTIIELFPWTAIFRKIETKGFKEDAGKMRFKGQFIFKKKNIHPLKQLFDIL